MVILDKLCTDLLDLIPESLDAVRVGVRSTKDKLLWTAPELEGLHWNRLIETLGLIDEGEQCYADVVRLFRVASAEKTAETRARRAERP